MAVFILLSVFTCACTQRTVKKAIPTVVEKMSAPEEKRGKLVFFYADWCGHCKKFMPEVKAYKGVQVEYVDCSSPKPAEKKLMKEYGVSGFPSMFYVDANNKRTPFTGDRTTHGIEAFVKSQA